MSMMYQHVCFVHVSLIILWLPSFRQRTFGTHISKVHLIMLPGTWTNLLCLLSTDFHSTFNIYLPLSLLTLCILSHLYSIFVCKHTFCGHTHTQYTHYSYIQNTKHTVNVFTTADHCNNVKRCLNDFHVFVRRMSVVVTKPSETS